MGYQHLHQCFDPSLKSYVRSGTNLELFATVFMIYMRI